MKVWITGTFGNTYVKIVTPYFTP